jgi:hypothetical protein
MQNDSSKLTLFTLAHKFLNPLFALCFVVCQQLREKVRARKRVFFPFRYYSPLRAFTMDELNDTFI